MIASKNGLLVSLGLGINNYFVSCFSKRFENDCTRVSLVTFIIVTMPFDIQNT